MLGLVKRNPQSEGSFFGLRQGGVASRWAGTPALPRGNGAAAEGRKKARTSRAEDWTERAASVGLASASTWASLVRGWDWKWGRFSRFAQLTHVSYPQYLRGAVSENSMREECAEISKFNICEMVSIGFGHHLLLSANIRVYLCSSICCRQNRAMFRYQRG